MLKSIVFTIAWLWALLSDAQNLIANSGFEDINICTEFAATCAPEAWFRIPAYLPMPSRNYPKAVEGERFGIVVMEDIINNGKHRISLYTPLICPLTKGARYQLSLLVNPSRNTTFKFGAWFSTQRPYLVSNDPKDHRPTLEITETSRTGTLDDGWQKIEIIFVASGGEEFLTLGNFDSSPIVLKKKDKNRLDLKYLFDQVELFQISPATEPCPDRESRIEAIYQQNNRHNDIVPMPNETEIIDTAVAPVAAPDSIGTTPSLDSIPAIQAQQFLIPDLSFDFGKYTLKPGADSILLVCADQIDRQPPSKIQILGFTDNVGSEAFNLELSTKRAESVQEWFVHKLKLPAALFMVEGLGETQPIASNDTADGRQANRRVVINLIR